MDKNEFNKDLDNYIVSRKHNSDGSKTILSGPAKLFDMFRKRIPDESQINERKEKQEEALEVMEEEIEEIHETEEVMETQREGIVKRFLKMLRFGNREDYPDDDEILEATTAQKALENEEIFKDTLRSLHKWLEALPPETLDAFKRSEDFKKYKLALENFGLIKKQ